MPFRLLLLLLGLRLGVDSLLESIDAPDGDTLMLQRSIESLEFGGCLRLRLHECRQIAGQERRLDRCFRVFLCQGEQIGQVAPFGFAFILDLVAVFAVRVVFVVFAVLLGRISWRVRFLLLGLGLMVSRWRCLAYNGSERHSHTILIGARWFVFRLCHTSGHP